MFPSKLPQVGTTIFTVMSALAKEHGAVNLSQGFPDFNPDERLFHYAEQAMRANANQYAPMPGNLTLREKLAEKYSTLHGYAPHPERNITITAGGAQAIFTAVQSCVQPGDEVLMFAPCYDCYAPAVALAGGVPVYYTMRAPDFRIDWQEVATLISPKTRLIILNTPHNPTGMCWTRADMQALEALVRDTAIVIISDEVYEHIIFDGRDHESVLRYPALRERAWVVNSCGKTYHCTGWKIGYVIAPDMLTTEFRKVHQYNVFSVHSVAQAAFAAMLDHPELYHDLPQFYERKRDEFRSLLQETPFQLLPCEGTYFQLADYSAISALPEIDFARWLTTTIGVAVIPISVFYPDGVEQSLVRFCFAKESATFEKAAERLAQL